MYYSLVCVFQVAAGFFLHTSVCNILLFMLIVATRKLVCVLGISQRQSDGKLAFTKVVVK